MMKVAASSTVSVLNSLIKTCNDGDKVFRWAAERVIVPELEAQFIEIASQRQQFAVELQRLVVDLGDKAATGGSFNGAMHRIWMHLKATTSEDTEDILLECRRVENANIEEYGYALDHDEMPFGIFDVVRRQYIAIKAAQQRVSNLLVRLGRGK